MTIATFPSDTRVSTPEPLRGTVLNDFFEPWAMLIVRAPRVPTGAALVTRGPGVPMLAVAIPPGEGWVSESLHALLLHTLMEDGFIYLLASGEQAAKHAAEMVMRKGGA